MPFSPAVTYFSFVTAYASKNRKNTTCLWKKIKLHLKCFSMEKLKLMIYQSPGWQRSQGLPLFSWRWWPESCVLKGSVECAWSGRWNAGDSASLSGHVKCCRSLVARECQTQKLLHEERKENSLKRLQTPVEVRFSSQTSNCSFFFFTGRRHLNQVICCKETSCCYRVEY